jgi:hypothetical protein
MLSKAYVFLIFFNGSESTWTENRAFGMRSLFLKDYHPSSADYMSYPNIAF